MFPKQLFYLTSDLLCVYQWQQGRLSAGRGFANDAAGLAAFARYLAGRANTPAYLLTDLIEEEFQRLAVPHVGGKAGQQLLRRRLSQLYRDSPYCTAVVQGRDSEGRRDDQVLFCALTNAALLQPWMEALEQGKIALAGMYSTSLLSALLVDKLAITQQHLLLVTQQSGGWRQSYFQHGQLRFSRLTVAIDRDGLPVRVAGETDKTQQFLTSTRLLERGQVLHAVILAPATQVARLQQECRSGPETAFRFITMERACSKVGLEQVPALSDQLFLALLGRRLPPSHYSLGPRALFYQLWRTRIGLYAASAAVLAGTVLWLGANLWGIVEAARANDRLRVDAQQYELRYAAIMSSLPPQVDKTRNMKAAVTIERLITQQAPHPLSMMTTLSAALEKVPEINLTQLDWKVSLPGASGQTRSENTANTPVSSLLIAFPTQPPQSLRVQAEVQLTQNNYRSALASINLFAQELARQPRLAVAIEETPLDVRPNVKLSGKAATETADSKAKFTLNLVWNP
ncbi:hypothetical protein AAKU55_001640 [Oxalobacteraceae bacterium GrIS 1.11]